MAQKKKLDDQTELLRTLLIVQLRLAGVSGAEIRAIVGGDMNRVTRIVKLLKPKSSRGKKADG